MEEYINQCLLPLPPFKNREADPTMASLRLSILGLAAITLAFCSVCDGKVMMDYIGATGLPASFDSVPIDPKIDFYFVLGYVIDSNANGAAQNGVFSPYWHSSITPAAIKSIKARHPNVKFLASLSGWTLHEKILRWYSPTDTQLWISNAFQSLTAILAKYNLDGIDVSYDTFARNDTTFVRCIGQLITQLRSKKLISVATIAPYYKTVRYYSELYEQFANAIDYVNYQFYIDRSATPPAYAKAFRSRAAHFGAAKLLAGYEVNGRGLQGDMFFEALRLLGRNGIEVNGVTIFSADASQSKGYYF